jgi:WD40 repeat protein
VCTVALPERAVAAAFSADNTHLAVSTAQTITVWNVAASSDTPEVQVEASGNTTALAFSPDGTTLASGGKDKYVVL